MPEVWVGSAADARSPHSSAQHIDESMPAAPSHSSEVPAAAGDSSLSQAVGQLVGAELPGALPTGTSATGSAAERPDAAAAGASIKAPGNDLGLTPEDYEAVTFDF
jgi:hypothetical protein